MDLSEFGKTIAKIAPALAGAVAGPAGFALATGIASMFGGDPNDLSNLARKIEQDPQAAIKLAEFETSLKIAMRQADSEDFKTEVNSVMNARQKVIELAKLGIRDYMTEVLAFIIIFGYFFLNYCFASSPATESKEILQNIRDLAMLVGAFYFGSSRGERKASLQQ